MAFFLTPRFAPAMQQCGPFSCAPTRASRPSVPPFVPFLSQVEELLSEIEREARRAEHAKRQQRKRIFRARFDVRENKEGYQVEGEVPGFEQENISIEVTDEFTLKVAGNTAQKSEQAQAPATSTQEVEDKMDGVTLNEHETEAPRATSPAVSETESHKSHQPTVEDDFEDLGAETSSTVSASEPKETKGKERAVEPTEAAVQQQPQAPVEPENREWLSERVHGSFERNFQFPERIDAAGVKASLRNGVLSVNVPKAPAPKVRQITIQ